MSGSPKMTKRLPLPVFLRSATVQVGVHASLEHGMRPSLVNSVVWASFERAGDQHVEPRIASLAGGGDRRSAFEG